MKSICIKKTTALGFVYIMVGCMNANAPVKEPKTSIEINRKVKVQQEKTSQYVIIDSKRNDRRQHKRFCHLRYEREKK